MNTQTVSAVWDLRLGNHCLYYFYVNAVNKMNSLAYEMLKGIGVFYLGLTSPVFFLVAAFDIIQV